ncbi:MAG: 2-oxoacid:acceptor oxidoreductase family protein [Endomicrobiia bacterium]|nr:2-oxoacid:acceptor oxidoreductase family protein [Endomicrobiaceae bacterium]MDD3053680.1 2-oxoacid:acceptor oxidoreductase family protein [Endomicrobiaceae bacterium]MDD3922818.1 2-oxoacid:acceptor oxidoreductase family protein [Endomicrobiaceae bacterium]MDD5102392.1 2-oxoacid:acceptor oxidoreductase family protein [Endomicrobiaceae bacterium]
MSAKMIEVRWHGRGGQGAKTAALLFAQALLTTGKYIQAFPEYGPERMGAPVQSFNRVSDTPITIHCGITEPQFVVILDPSLLDAVDVTEGVGTQGKVIVNTSFSAEEMAKKLGIAKEQVFVVNASKISTETIGKDIPNTPMLGALVKVIGNLDINGVLDDTKSKLEVKFRSKPEVIEGNLTSIKRAYDEVKNS